MKSQPPLEAFGPAVNRISDVMFHQNLLSGRGGTSRVAEIARVSPSSISRLINGKFNPSYLMVIRVLEAIEQEFGFRLDSRELVAENGRFLTPFVCDVVPCRGCLPPNALDEFGARKAAFNNIKPGEWVASRYPRGYEAWKGDHG